ncbi:MAG: hypothetical protein FGM16_06860 [Flavobacterium sp.]|jgi:hypothetical protein|nr:hypothetical protein [Flavobacterium sp.]
METKRAKLGESDPIELLDNFTKQMPDIAALQNWGKTIMKGMEAVQKQPKVVEKRTCKIGRVTIKASLCDNGAIAIEFPDQKTAEKYFFEHFKTLK